jgi:hypothetical protein
VLEFDISQLELKKLIDATQFSMASQDVRYYLNGMLFESEGHGLRTGRHHRGAWRTLGRRNRCFDRRGTMRRYCNSRWQAAYIVAIAARTGHQSAILLRNKIIGTLKPPLETMVVGTAQIVNNHVVGS